MRWRRAHARLEDPPAAPPRLTIRSERDGAAHILQPVGELDLDTVAEFEHELKRVEATAPAEIRVDLSGVNFIDNDGLKLLLNANARSRERHGRFLLLRGPEAVQRALQMSGLETHMPFAD